MKQVFIINPCAGKSDCSDDIAAAVDIAEIEAELYCTTGPKDATRFVRQWLAAHPGEAVRFHACGGDGTLNEVVSGVLDSGQAERAEVGCYPCGSGNDFSKTLGCEHPDVKDLVSAPSIRVDVIRFQTDPQGGSNVHYAINTLNFGFEAAVCRTMGKVRRWPLLGGRMAYTTGIVHSLLRQRRHHCTVTVDGTLWSNEELMILSLANGQWAGGGYHCSPRASLNDGLIDIMSVKPLSVPRFARLAKYYKSGELLDHTELSDIVNYIQGRRISIESDRNTVIGADGEIFNGQSFDIECLPGALRFVKP